MNVGKDPLGLAEISRQANEAQLERVRMRRDDARPFLTRWIKETSPYVTGAILDERYGDTDDEPMKTVRPALEDQWRRALGHLEGVTTLEIDPSQVGDYYKNRFLYEIYGWETNQFLRKRASDAVRVKTPSGVFVADFSPEFTPRGMQVHQMYHQLRVDGRTLPAEEHDPAWKTPRYDQRGRYWPRPRDLSAGRMNASYLASTNGNHSLLVRGLDFDETAAPTNTREANDALHSGLERVRQRLFDPVLSTLASVAITYTPDGHDKGMSDTVYIPNPYLPIMAGVPTALTEAQDTLIRNLELPRSWIKRLLKEDRFSLELVDLYVTSQDSHDISALSKRLHERTRVDAEQHLFPVTDEWLMRNTERGAYLLDLIDAR